MGPGLRRDDGLGSPVGWTRPEGLPYNPEPVLPETQDRFVDGLRKAGLREQYVKEPGALRNDCKEGTIYPGGYKGFV
jgi:hypothetical protein